MCTGRLRRSSPRRREVRRLRSSPGRSGRPYRWRRIRFRRLRSHSCLRCIRHRHRTRCRRRRSAQRPTVYRCRWLRHQRRRWRALRRTKRTRHRRSSDRPRIRCRSPRSCRSPTEDLCTCRCIGPASRQRIPLACSRRGHMCRRLRSSRHIVRSARCWCSCRHTHRSLFGHQGNPRKSGMFRCHRPPRHHTRCRSSRSAGRWSLS